MHETAEDIAELQRLLDRSHGAAGQHLRGILADDLRLSAEDLPPLLTGVQILVVATVTTDARPIAGPVDGLFYRGRFHFGTSPNAVRLQHLRARPQVSAVHARGEELVVTVHGEAVFLDLDGADAGFRDYLLEVYGEGWSDWGGESPYLRIEPAKMFASRLPGAS